MTRDSIRLVTTVGGISEPLPTMTARMGPPRGAIAILSGCAGTRDGTMVGRCSDGVRWPIVGLTQRVTYVIGRNRKVRLAFHSELDMDAHSAEACLALAEQAPSA